MRLTRDELVHATNSQLGAIGVTRRMNAGWLKKAVKTDFAAHQIDRFRQIGLTRPLKNKKPPREHAELFSQSSEADSSNSPEAEINAIYLANREEFE